MGGFWEERVKVIEKASGQITPKQRKRLSDALLAVARSDPNRLLSSESFRIHQANIELKTCEAGTDHARKAQTVLMKGRDRNNLCKCGSNRKYKKCCGK